MGSATSARSRGRFHSQVGYVPSGHVLQGSFGLRRLSKSRICKTRTNAQPNNTIQTARGPGKLTRHKSPIQKETVTTPRRVRAVTLNHLRWNHGCAAVGSTNAACRQHQANQCSWDTSSETVSRTPTIAPEYKQVQPR